jgi:hypothetical protein
MIYKGNAKIKDTGSFGVYKGSQAIRKIYKGSELVYLYSPFEPEEVLINFSESKTVTQALPQGKYYVEIVGGGGTGSYGQAGYWQERYGGGSGARWSATVTVTNDNHTIKMECGGGVGSPSKLTIDDTLVATAGGGGTPTAGSVTAGSTSITNIAFSDITSRSGNQGGYTFTVEGTSTGNASSVASQGQYGQGAASSNSVGTDYNRKLGWIYLKFIEAV